VIGDNVTWAGGYRLCQDEIFHGYLSRVSKRPASVKAFADARSFQSKPPDDTELLDRFTG
jgi:glutathione S-transferase